MEEFTATIQEVASNTLNAAELAQQAQQLADAGRLRVGLAHHSIGLLAETLNSSARAVATLTQQSQAIGRILDVIRGIAEQTNLLALNAAIELRAPERMAAASPWWPMRCAPWPSAPSPPPMRFRP